MAKRKVSITVSTRLIEQVDGIAGELGRSRAVEEALALWLRERRRKHLEHEVERYYEELSAADRAKDAAWASAGAKHVAKTWD
jgi:metal-responsive CopG/Arc/MetJ family transcriptional regulator